jgi:hypothetical protein
MRENQFNLQILKLKTTPTNPNIFNQSPKKNQENHLNLNKTKKEKKTNKYSGKRSVQFADFGVIARENTVTSGHASIGRDNAVISSGNCNARSAHNKYIHHKL